MATLYRGQRSTAECFLSSALSKLWLQTSDRVSTKRIRVRATIQHCRGEQTERFCYKARKGNFYVNVMAVFVVDKQHKPLMPCSEKRARLLLNRRKARIHSFYPFVIRLVDRTAEESALQPVRCKIDPGSKTTGIALVREDKEQQSVLFLMELTHRADTIRKTLQTRASLRRRRRSTLRYRPKRFANRKKPKGSLAPSLSHRLHTTLAWVQRLQKRIPLKSITCERVRFDTQKLLHPEIDGVEYSQGTLFGYEIREYLLEKWGRRCVYCDKQNIPLQIDHIIPKSKGGSNRIANLTLACSSCNLKKGNLPVETFTKKAIRSPPPLQAAAAVNSTRNALWAALIALPLPCEAATGGQTKYNRQRFSIPKTHALDAACTGTIHHLNHWNIPIQHIVATGRGSYKRSRCDRFGFPRGFLLRQKKVYGFQTGDQVIAKVPTGKKKGCHIGRVAIRASGNFNIQTALGVVQGIPAKYCRLIQRVDGYHYLKLTPAFNAGDFQKNQQNRGAAFPPSPKGLGFHAVK
jgi:5-methylcytosine-specific restriction endonuclease McrA